MSSRASTPSSVSSDLVHSSALHHDIWVEILDIVDPETARNISLTSRALRNVALPYVFRAVEFHDYTVTTETSLLLSNEIYTLTLPDDEEVERTEQRIKFLSSDRIAPMIRELSIVLKDIDGVRVTLDGPSKETEGGYPGQRIAPRIFDILPCFPNIRKLHFSTVRFDAVALAALCKLKNLRTLEVTDCRLQCSFDDLKPLERLRLSRLSCMSDAHVPSMNLVHWLSAMDVCNTSAISVVGVVQSAGAEDLLRYLAHWGTESALGASLRELQLPEDDVILKDLDRALEACPRLTKLVITWPPAGMCLTRPWRARKGVDPAQCVPALETYIGPLELLDLVTASPVLTRVSLSRSCRKERLEYPGHMQAETAVRVLRAHHLADVQVLSVLLVDVTHDAFAAVCAAFPGLRELRIQCWHSTFEEETLEKDLIELLGKRVPADLEALHICERSADDTAEPDASYPYDRITTHLETAYPNLNTFTYLVKDNYGLRWART